MILVAAALVVSLGSATYLTLRNPETGAVYARYRVAEGERFSVQFVHSVNKSPVIDCYQVRGGKVYVTQTVYYNFGAGVQTELGPGESLSYGDDGAMIVSGIDREMDGLYYFAGTVSDHILTIGGREVSLRTLCGRNSRVEILCAGRWD